MRDEMQTLFFQKNTYLWKNEKPEDVGSLLRVVILNSTKQELGHCYVQQILIPQQWGQNRCETTSWELSCV